MSLTATEHPGPESESVPADDLAAADERDEQSASEPCETDGIHGTPVVETDSKPRLLSTHIDSATVAIPPSSNRCRHSSRRIFRHPLSPWNRSGFRYLACGPPVDQQHQDAEYPTYYTIETSPPGLVKWSWEDRSSYVYATKDGLSVTTDRGFRSARANLPIREGRWYFEIIMVRAGGEINHGARSEPEEAHVRVGIARRESGLNAPLGIDGYSYGIRDKTGEKVHLSRPQKYGESFGSGDVIGILIDLPKMRKPNDGDCDDPARIERKRIPIRYRRQLYFESAEYPISKEMEDLADSALPAKLQPNRNPQSNPNHRDAQEESLPGQKQVDEEPLQYQLSPVDHLYAIYLDLLDFLPLRVDSSPQNNEFWHHLSEDPNPDANNVKSVESLHDDGTLGYYPCVSVYGGGIARLNSGPEFKFAPPESNNYPLGEEADLPEKGISSDTDTRDDSRHTNKAWRPLSELYPIHIAEQRRLDELDIIEGQKQLAEATQKAELTPTDVTNAKPKFFSKRKRVSSPSSTSLGTSTTKGKKKGKVGRPSKGSNLRSSSLVR
ncbi:hypothetical protein KEM48_013597 [Puccinia striiformis f. sp. tritici PST-130]|nr:hypothetical protein KEM48_013597 [Puccinia striiformis f. sp. tritici PST-130]